MPQNVISLRGRYGFAIALILAACSGCAEKPPQTEFPVAGRVTFEGQPVSGGTVTFYSRSNNGGGPISPDGTFKVNGDGLRPNLYYVAITPPDPAMPPPLPGAPRPERPEHPEIPAKYRTPVGSGFEAQVEAKENYFEFAMVLQPAEPPTAEPASAEAPPNAPEVGDTSSTSPAAIEQPLPSPALERSESDSN